MKKLQILGTGCPKCKKLAEQVETAAEELGIAYQLEKITDINEILDFGIMMTPGFAIDGQVKTSGTLPGMEEIKRMLKE